VVWQPYQFSWTHDDISDDMIDGPAKELAYRIAWESLNTPRDNDATHYHATYTLPYWAASLEYTQTIGLHKFYK
jgi:spore germination cell wall hydrolase CwlJ-like protein